MAVQKIAAFSDGNTGGNPAGVLIAEQHPSEAEMRQIAADVGFSETAFAAPLQDAFRVRYFSPESEVPFCGHATIALGAALAMSEGDGTFKLVLNEAEITVEGRQQEGRISAALQSPPTHSAAAPPELVAEVLALFGYTADDLDPNLPPACANGGADHLIVGLNTRAALAAMQYDLAAGRDLMNREALVTIMFAYAATPQRFHTRNPFASGGIYEDPATGAAAAALAGYLREIDWSLPPTFEIIQGEDIGQASRIVVELSPKKGSSVKVSGRTSRIAEPLTFKEPFKTSGVSK